MVMMVILFSLVAMMGFMGWVYKITGSDRFLFALLNTSMPIILLTIANSDGVHVITKFFREFRKLGNVTAAVETSMDALLLPIFLTSITNDSLLHVCTSPIRAFGRLRYMYFSWYSLWAWLMSS